ncbi:MAG: hypothetical protein ACRDIY_18925 [Chloroflexota bacterium]
MSTETRVQIGETTIEIVAQNLLQMTTPAIMLSANNNLRTSPIHWSWSQEVEKRAGSTYREECSWVSRSAGPTGLPQGCAAVTGAGALSTSTSLRWVIQAITTHYDNHSNRRPATPEIVYQAVRAGLEKAEVFRIDAVATYVMAIRKGFSSASDDQMAEALFRALFDHAAVASSLKCLMVCETDAARLATAVTAMNRVVQTRISVQPNVKATARWSESPSSEVVEAEGRVAKND